MPFDVDLFRIRRVRIEVTLRVADAAWRLPATGSPLMPVRNAAVRDVVASVDVAPRSPRRLVDGQRHGSRTAAAQAGERGMALIATLMAALLLVALAGVLAPLSMIETAVGVNHRRAVQALYAAEAALELAAAELGSLPDWSAALNGSARSAFREATLAPAMPDGASHRPDRDRRRAAGERRRIDFGRARARLEAVRARPPQCAWMRPYRPDYGPWLVAVWIADDAADPNPDSGLDGNDAIVAHAAAFGPRGARRAVQATLVRQASTPAGDPHARENGGVVRRPVKEAARGRARWGCASTGNLPWRSTRILAAARRERGRNGRSRRSMGTERR